LSAAAASQSKKSSAAAKGGGLGVYYRLADENYRRLASFNIVGG